MTCPPRTGPGVELGSEQKEAKNVTQTIFAGGDHQQAARGGCVVEPGQIVSEVVRQLGFSEQTYYRWEKEYGGLDKTQARKLKAFEKENLQLKTLVADLSLDNAILKEVLSNK